MLVPTPKDCTCAWLRATLPPLSNAEAWRVIWSALDAYRKSHVLSQQQLAILSAWRSADEQWRNAHE